MTIQYSENIKKDVLKQFNAKAPIIGLIGGMGSYATLDFYKKILDSFDVSKEWDRPHIIIDNFCTMPSRVKNIMNPDENEISMLIESLTYSVKKMIDYGVDIIILTCNTSHYFIKDIIDIIPNSSNYILNMISTTMEELHNNNIKEYAILATEGTLKSRLFEIEAEKFNLITESPTEVEYSEIRIFIENVKQNRVDLKIMENFVNFLHKRKSDVIVLGCTELPILYKSCLNEGYKIEKTIIDPADVVVKSIKKKYDQ